MEDGRSLSETPSWAVATVITIIVAVGFSVHGSLRRIGKWLARTKRRALVAALEKIKDELILFGVLSLLMGHWAIWVAKICVKRSALSSRFYPCVEEGYNGMATPFKHLLVASGDSLNHSFFQEQEKTHRHDYCSEVLFFLNPFG